MQKPNFLCTKFSSTINQYYKCSWQIESEKEMKTTFGKTDLLTGTPLLQLSTTPVNLRNFHFKVYEM
jgi:hypothetical protein